MVKLNKTELIRALITILLICTAITIASVTIGRDIYNDSRDEGLLSFGIVNACGYLFFLFMPVELAFIYYLNGDINIFALNGVAIGTALFSQAIDYCIGLSVSNKFIDKLVGRNRYEKAGQKIVRYGNLTILIFNALPLSSPVISLAAGMLRHRIRDTIIFTVLGLIVKYIALSMIF